MLSVAFGVSLLVIAGFGARYLLSSPSDIIMPANQTQADAEAALPDAAPAVVQNDEPQVDEILAQAASAVTAAPTPAPAPALTQPVGTPEPAGEQVSAEAILETAALLDEKPAVPETATYRLAIKPWGTVYVDGKEKGVSPPLKKLVLPAGKHKIRVANPGFPDYNMDVNLSKGKTSTIDVDFTARSK